MLSIAERHKHILDKLNAQGFVKVLDIARELDVTPVTIRKDLKLLEEKRPWDLLIIGGGATGLGVAVDASSRGYRVLLVEQHDFAKATSSRSTKLVHGGVRYLQQGDVSMVVEALHERGRLWRNARQ